MKPYFLPFFGVPCCEKMLSNDFLDTWINSRKLIEAQSPTQAEVIFVVGKVTQKQAPLLQNLWSQFVYPARCIHFSGCEKALHNYAIVEELTQVIKVDLIVADCAIDQDSFETVLLKLRELK